MNRGEKQAGFTLIELMVALAIAIIVITLSTPLSNVFRQNRVTTQVHEFVTDLNLARSTAVSNGSCVSICIADVDNPQTCKASTAGDATETWEDGWLVFSDFNCNAAIDAGDGDTIMKSHARLNEGFSLQVQSTNVGVGADNNNDRETITYQATGIAPNSAGVWTLCDPSANQEFQRGIEISLSGRVQIHTDAAQAIADGVNIAACPAG